MSDCVGGAHLADGAGRGIERVGPQRLDGVDDDEVGALALGQRRQDVGEIGLARRAPPAPSDSPRRSARRRTCAAASSPEK